MKIHCKKTFGRALKEAPSICTLYLFPSTEYIPISL